MNEMLGASQTNRVFVQPHRVCIPALDARQLGTHERRAVGEIVGAAARPCTELIEVSAHDVARRALRRRARAPAPCRVRERAIEMIVGELQEGRRVPCEAAPPAGRPREPRRNPP